jgi:hypothetical protein
MPVTCTLPVFSFRTGRFPSSFLATGTTDRPASLSASSITRASRFSFAAFSSSSDFGSGITNAIEFPSGAHANELIEAFSLVTDSASPPATRMMKMLFLSPPRCERNASHCPSADHRGLVADLSPRVSCTALEPSLDAR